MAMTMIKIAFDASSDSGWIVHNYNLLLSIYKSSLQEKKLFIFLLFSISYAVFGSVVLHAEG
jgi:hypothetical protein